MSEMADRIARAIFDAEWRDSASEEKFPGSADQNFDTWKRKYRLFARAAIKAMREPSPAMIAAAWTVFDRYPHKRLGPGPGFKEAIAAALDAALKE